MKAGKSRSRRRSSLVAQTGPTREVIEKLAELMWENAGREEGRQADYRRLAEAELTGGARARHPHANLP